MHHAKVLYSRDDPQSSTKVIFLRFCDPSCHEQVIKKLNGIEWPIGSGKYLNFEFNRNSIQQHHLLARERFVKTLLFLDVRGYYGLDNGFEELDFLQRRQCFDRREC